MDRRALLIAASRYDDKSLARLPGAEGDLEALTTVLRDADLGGFGVVDHALNEPKATLEPRVHKWLTAAGRADLVLVYFSGHGIRKQDQEGSKLYLATPETEVEFPESTAILARSVFNFMLQCRCRQQLLLLDCCYAGQLISDLFAPKSPMESASKEFELLIKRERKAFGIMTASLGRERAWPIKQRLMFRRMRLRSAFTDAVVKGISSGDADRNQDGRVSFDELFGYVDDRLASDGRQTPEPLSRGGPIIVAGTPGQPLRPDERPAPAPRPRRRAVEPSDALEALLERWPAPKLADVDTEWLGVTELPWLPTAPPYVPRPSVDAALERSLRDGRLVVAHGPPAAGKSRSLYQAARKVFPGHRVLQPKSSDALAPLVQRLAGPPLAGEPIVIWLTNLERFLVPGGLDVKLLARIGEAAPQATVVATLASEQHRRLGQRSESEIVRPFVEVLAPERAQLVEVPARLEPAERRTVREDPFYESMDMLADFGPDLARHDDLLRSWRNLQREPLATAVVQAAVDWHRMGMDRPPPEEYLRELVPHYLDGSASQAVEADDRYEAALERAAHQGPRKVQLLQREPAGSHNEVLVNRYLIDLSEREGRRIPPACWRVVIDIARPREALVVGFSAYTRREPQAAQYAWEEAVKDDLPVGWLWLGRLALESSGERTASEEARTALRRAAGGEDDPEVALEASRVLAETLRAARAPAAEVSEAYATVIETGHPHWSPWARLRLGLYRQERGDHLDAYPPLQQARESPDKGIATEAAYRLGVLATDHGDHLPLQPDARHQLILECLEQARQSPDKGIATEAAYRLGVLATDHGDHLPLQPDARHQLILECLEQARAAAIPHLSGPAALRLGRFHLERGRTAAARDTFARARRCPDPATAADAAYRLAILAQERPDHLGLEPEEQGALLLDTLTQARRAPDPTTVTDAALRLAILAQERPDHLGLSRQRAEQLACDCLEAARWSTDAAVSSRATLRLGLLMRDRRALMAARDLLDEARGAAQSEVAAEAAFALGVLTLEHGDELGIPVRDKARFGLVCFDHACRSPDQAIATAAACRLGLLLLRQGERLDLSPAERDQRIRACLEHARSSPDPQWAGTACLELGRYLARGSADRAERLFREACRSPVQQVTAQAAYELGKLLLEAQDREQDAIDALTQALGAESDLPQCQVNLLLGDAYLQLGRRLRGRQEPSRPDASEAQLELAAERYRAAQIDRPASQRLRADRGLADASVELAMTAWSPERARGHLETALDLYEGIMRAHPRERAGLWPDAARVRSRLAQVLADDAEVRDIADAQAQYRRALGICLAAQDPPPGKPRVDAQQLRRMLGAWLARLRHEEGAAGSGKAAPQRTEEFLHELAKAARHLDEAAVLDLAQQLRSWGQQSKLQQSRLYVSAVGLCQRVGRGSDQEAAAWLLAGELLYTLGTGAGGSADHASLLERSQASLTRAVAAARKPQPDAEYLLGRLAERLGPLPEAVDHYWRAADPRQAPRRGGDPNRRREALWRIARLSERQRQRGSAMTAYTQLLSAPQPYAGPARRRRRLLRLVPLSARAPEPPLADSAAKDARQLEERLRIRQQQATDAGTVLIVGGIIAGLGVLELVAWLAATPLGPVPQIGPALQRSHDVLGRFGLLDLAVGALWGAYGLLLMSRTAAMVSDRVRQLVMPAILTLGSLALQRGFGGLTRTRFEATPAVAWVAALLGLVATAIWLVVARLSRR